MLWATPLPRTKTMPRGLAYGYVMLIATYIPAVAFVERPDPPKIMRLSQEERRKGRKTCASCGHRVFSCTIPLS